MKKPGHVVIEYGDESFTVPERYRRHVILDAVDGPFYVPHWYKTPQVKRRMMTLGAGRINEANQLIQINVANQLTGFIDSKLLDMDYVLSEADMRTMDEKGFAYALPENQAARNKTIEYLVNELKWKALIPFSRSR